SRPPTWTSSTSPPTGPTPPGQSRSRSSDRLVTKDAEAGRHAMRTHALPSICALCFLGGEVARADWLMAKAYKLPSEFTNQESGYFSIIEGQNGKLYIGCAKYGVNAYLVEFDPKAEKVKMVMDVHEVIGSKATGFAAQAKLHTRNNVGTVTGKIYVASKQ